ncbi:GFA family protein [Brevundimonas sp.]|uniref:GFA family protein n=1 Tax=Brevundimonas sp. TaxID=1871086 RepID=UPI003565D17E
MDARLSGRCLCGAVSFTASPKGGMHACHCGTCRHISGGILFSVDCGDSVEVQGDVATYASSDWATRQFCPACGTGLFWRANDGGITMVSAQAFDDPTAFALEDEFCIESKPATYALAGDRPRLTTEQLWAQFAAPEA